MERSEYLSACQKSETVLLNGNKYTAVSYVLSFNKKGECVHGAVLRDEKANSHVSCLLKDVCRFEAT